MQDVMIVVRRKVEGEDAADEEEGRNREDGGGDVRRIQLG